VGGGGGAAAGRAGREKGEGRRRMLGTTGVEYAGMEIHRYVFQPQSCRSRGMGAKRIPGKKRVARGGQSKRGKGEREKVASGKSASKERRKREKATTTTTTRTTRRWRWRRRQLV
jgi:hypothetical protein